MGANHQIMMIEQLKDIGNRLLQSLSSSSSPQLILNLLDETLLLLSKVGQAPSQVVLEALLLTMKALISEKLMGNSDADVVITVVACLNEIMRISAPVAPYDDEKMREIFKLTVLSFDNLSCPPGRHYSMAVLILESVANLESCVMMLDLDCGSLVTTMFELFQKHISSNHPQSVILAMEKIMCVMIIENDSLSLELLKVLLDSITKENENNSSEAFKLGVKVIEECSEKLKPYIMEAVTSMGCCLDDYAPILSSICETEPIALEDLVHVSAKHPVMECCSQNSETDSETACKKGENLRSYNTDEGVQMKRNSEALTSKKTIHMMEDEASKRPIQEVADPDNNKVHLASLSGDSSDLKEQVI